jgi:hypothetical protein
MVRKVIFAVLLIVASIPVFSKAAEQRTGRDALTETRPWLAPTGHRQPHAADVPQEFSGTDDQLDAALDRRLRICRGC